MELSEKYIEIDGLTETEDGIVATDVTAEVHKLEVQAKSLTRSTEMTWAVLQKRRPMIGGHISSSTENVITDLEKALKYCHDDKEAMQERIDVFEEQVRKLEAAVGETERMRAFMFGAGVYDAYSDWKAKHTSVDLDPQ